MLAWLWGVPVAPVLTGVILDFLSTPYARCVGSLPIVPRCALPGQAGFGGYAVLRTVTMLNSYAAP